MTPKTYTVRFEQAEPEPMWITFEGVHFKIIGTLAFFYRLFKVMRSEEEAQYQLRPWLLAEKAKAATAPQQIAAQIAQ